MKKLLLAVLLLSGCVTVVPSHGPIPFHPMPVPHFVPPGHNPFHHLGQDKWTFTTIETREIHMKGYKPLPAGVKKFKVSGLRDVALPASFDPREKLSPIQDQGQCGSCYSFAVTDAMTDTLMLYGKGVGVLSQQWIMDDTGYGCEGGNIDVGSIGVAPGGLPLLSTYPYVAKDQKKLPMKIAGQAADYQMMDTPTTHDIQKILVTQSMVPTALDASSDAFQSYSSGVFNDCPKVPQLDHAVEIVGYTNHGTWIVKNSWGSESWGMNGYFEIPYGACGIGSEAGFFF